MQLLGKLIVAFLALFTFQTGAVVRYVNVDNPTPTPPYTNWSSAATNIQKAIDIAVAGDSVLVTNGVYRTGGRAVFGTMTNRVAVTKALKLQSVNGPAVTIIEGYQVPTTTNGDGAIRCVYLTNGASLVGFTLTNGATRNSGDFALDRCGGGLWCEIRNTSISNCVVIGNSASGNGAGTFYGNLTHCLLTRNSAVGNGGGSSGGTLNYCTLLANSATIGGGAYSSVVPGGPNGAMLNNCRLSENFASSSGGGAYSGILKNCVISRNISSNQAGGAGNSTLNNCTITGNMSGHGGGTSGGTLNNCIIYFNIGNANDYNGVGDGATMNNCCISPAPDIGNGNISSDPKLASDQHLSSESPCRGLGATANATGVDIDGEPWRSPPSIGCDEYHEQAIVGPLEVTIKADYTNVAVGSSLSFVAVINGHAASSEWDFGDGTMVKNRPYVDHAWALPGDYSVILRAANESWPNGVITTTMVHVVSAPILYVDKGSGNPTPPYNSWPTAAVDIQSAVDAASVPGALVLVTNGIYATGGRAVYGAMTNRVVIDKPLVVRSVNGPAFTVIQGHRVPGTTNGDTAIRCVYLSSGAVLEGFTLTNGATRMVGNSDLEQKGGALWSESTSAVASNCIIVGNSAYKGGGGAIYGKLQDCLVSNNYAMSGYGGGAYRGILNDCALRNNFASSGGGATYESILNDCTISTNSTRGYGGGAYNGSLSKCQILGNNALEDGGGAYLAMLNGCRLSGNSAKTGGGTYSSGLKNCILIANEALSQGGGAVGGTLINCTVIANTAPTGGGVFKGTIRNSILYYNSASISGDNSSGTPLSISYSCSTPTEGIGNFAVAPTFVDQDAGNLRLQTNSPCINAGSNLYIVDDHDFDGNPRISGGTVDVGAYEFQSPSSLLSYAWAQENGFPTDGSEDLNDSDGDGANNLDEWRADTNPTNALLALRMLSATEIPFGSKVTWQSVSTRSYFLERTTNLATTSFSAIATNIPGTTGETTFTDTTATNGRAYFYRVGIN